MQMMQGLYSHCNVIVMSFEHFLQRRCHLKDASSGGRQGEAKLAKKLLEKVMGIKEAR